MALDPPAPFELSTAMLQGVEIVGVPIPKDAVLVAGIVTLVALVVLSAFFSSSEIAMFSLPAHRTEALVEDAVPGAKTLKQLKSDPHRLLVTILVGNNLVNIAMSSIATGLLAMYVDSQGLAVAIATFGVTAVVLLFGESAPKSYAVENTESWALRISKPLKAAEKVLLPLILLFDYLTRVVNKITGGRSAIETSYVTREEIQDIIETGEREGVLDEDEREMLQRTLRFNDTIAKEVMTPRLDMTAVAKEASAEEALETCIQSGHARIPVYEGSLDNVIGVIHIRDLVRDLNYGEAVARNMDLEDLIEPTLHVPESKNVDDLLTEMRAERLHMVIVIDEFGTTEGLVTMEDLTEEIVGEILEGEEEEPIEYVDDDTVTVKGEVNIEEVNEALDLDLPEGEEFETIAGFIFNRAGRLVEEGETITYDGVEIRVEQVENTRIMKARVVRLETDETESVDAEEVTD
ncbi:DNA-binding protein [Haloarcula hispanica N601]|uniref:DNA-binding protein n=3 Tax=Haloarcula hispanica TaxID=51589 RepID=V5TQT6_HALHI|nr:MULTISPECIES: hemolysin family protein [Haloarcula]AEM58594.1 CBS domain-containing protein [Haloarcula hispanica ATCC 33960]AHB67317.1 DNA-binding protein [Haloarcula hispanica N601]AJF25579.1 DNA-binding protein [Haloarcula sp. CBA1115]KAA9405777.1 HlyC/CorC family transporter [Haloarcula sp. CBA1131]KAA9408330.1 HlyC/CorC family transporter [Haloarcula hispanica]